MNNRERFLAVMDFDVSVKPPLWEWGYWGETIDKWRNEISLPTGYSGTVNETGTIYPGSFVKDHAPLDPDPLYLRGINTGMLPAFERKIISEDAENMTVQSERGIIMKIRKDGNSTPLFIDFPVKDQRSFEKVKERLQPKLEERYPDNWTDVVKKYQERDYPLFIAGYPYGFFGGLREWMGFDHLMFSLYDDPHLVKDMGSFLCEFLINVWSKATYDLKPDAFIIWEDMAYKNGPMISPDMFREFMLPNYKKLTGFFRDCGIKNFFVDTDGNCEKLIPLFLEGGVTGIYPLEVQAGMDVVALRKKFPKLQMMGGLDKMKIAIDKNSIDKELNQKIPFMCTRGGYIPHVDHFVSPDISWENFKYYRSKLKEMILGKKMT